MVNQSLRLSSLYEFSDDVHKIEVNICVELGTLISQWLKLILRTFWKMMEFKHGQSILGLTSLYAFLDDEHKIRITTYVVLLFLIPITCEHYKTLLDEVWYHYYWLTVGLYDEFWWYEKQTTFINNQNETFRGSNRTC